MTQRIWLSIKARKTSQVCKNGRFLSRGCILHGRAGVFSGKWKDEKARRRSTGRPAGRQKWDPLERPRAYRALSTKCRTCRCLPSNEDQTLDRAHFVVPPVLHVPGPDDTGPPGPVKYARAPRASSHVYLKILRSRRHAQRHRKTCDTPFIIRYLIHPDVVPEVPQTLCQHRRHRRRRAAKSRTYREDWKSHRARFESQRWGIKRAADFERWAPFCACV